MSTIVLKDNIERALNKLYKLKNIEKRQDVLFKITVNEEEKLKMKSNDLLYFPYNKIGDTLLNEQEVISVLSGPRCTFPLWVEMTLCNYDKEKVIIKLTCSCRFRKSAELHNQDTGFPPFQIV